MKFTDGYWMIKPEMTPIFGMETVSWQWRDGALTVLVASRPIEHRGGTLNLPTLTLTLTSPLPGIVRVHAAHHKGTPRSLPQFQTPGGKGEGRLAEEEDALYFCSGELRARVPKKGSWNLEFQDAKGACVTKSDFRGLAHMHNRETGRKYMLDSLSLDVGECVYGLGERFTAYVKNGQSVDMWNGDGGTSSELAYKNIPFYMTNRGYGVFVEDAGDVSFEVASEKVERVQFSVEGEHLCYDVIYGPDPKEVLSRYTRLTGRPALPPAWSFGLWLTTSFTTSYDEQTVSSFIDGMAERDIPLSVFHFDCFWMKGFQWCDFQWDPEVFPDPEGMLTRLKAKGLKICAWINPYIAQHSYLFDEGMEQGYLVKNTDGSVWQSDLWQAGMGLVDFTNPDAACWYQQKLKALLDMGVDCFKTDFGERIPVKDIVYFDRSSPLQMHNYYTHLYNKAVFELLERERGQTEAVLFARSATAGGQMFPVHWGGDSSAQYISMAETLRGGLSLAHCGFGFWSHDMGGFEHTASADVYKRWCAFGMLSSHSRLHGSSSYRVPWLFDEEASDVLRHFAKLKNRMMPYLFFMAVEAHKRGIPMLRPMMLEFPDDPGCDMLDLQYMLGESVLVSPVFRQDGRTDYYLPRGRWTHLLDGRVVDGGHYMREQYGYFSLPLWVREGAVLVMGAEDQRPDYPYVQNPTVHIYAPCEGMHSTAMVPDGMGEQVGGVTARMQGGVLTVTQSGLSGARIALFGAGPVHSILEGRLLEDGQIAFEGDSVRIAL